MLIFGKHDTLYDILDAQAAAANEAAQALVMLTCDFDNLAKHARGIKEIERHADKLTHKFINRVDSTFVTPLDKEDLHALTSRLDDVTDAIEAAASRMALYHLPDMRDDMNTMAALLVTITQEVCQAVSALRHLHDKELFQAALAHIHATESACDTAFREALAALFTANNPDPLTVIKWKDIFERIEKAPDICEQLANILEGIMVKYA